MKWIERSHLPRLEVLCLKVKWYLWHQQTKEQGPFSRVKAGELAKIVFKTIRTIFFCNLCPIIAHQTNSSNETLGSQMTL